MTEDIFTLMSGYSDIQAEAHPRFRKLRDSSKGDAKEDLRIIRAYGTLVARFRLAFGEIHGEICEILNAERPRHVSTISKGDVELAREYFPDEWAWICQHGMADSEVD